MNDKPTILFGLVIALVALTFPFWYTLAAGQSGPGPDLELPEGQCVEEGSWMRANHMHLLNQWRDAVVRQGEKTYTSRSGARYEMSLAGTCLGCHTSEETFCYRCHVYANVVSPREPGMAQGAGGGLHCWHCHVVPEGNE